MLWRQRIFSEKVRIFVCDHFVPLVFVYAELLKRATVCSHLREDRPPLLSDANALSERLFAHVFVSSQAEAVVSLV